MTIVYGTETIKGPLRVLREDAEFTAKTLSASEQLYYYTPSMLVLDNATAQDVILPNCSTLTTGYTWDVVIKVTDASAAGVNVKTYHDTLPVLLQALNPGDCYVFTCYDPGTEAGSWIVDEIGSVPSASRYAHTHNSTSDWSGPSGGFYTITISEATHTKGLNPVVTTLAGTAPSFEGCRPDTISVNSSTGAVTVKVLENPNTRYAGKITIM